MMLSTSYMGETGNWNNGKSNGLYHLVWDKLLKILSVSLSSWGGGHCYASGTFMAVKPSHAASSKAAIPIFTQLCHEKTTAPTL